MEGAEEGGGRGIGYAWLLLSGIAEDADGVRLPLFAADAADDALAPAPGAPCVRRDRSSTLAEYCAPSRRRDDRGGLSDPSPGA